MKHLRWTLDDFPCLVVNQRNNTVTEQPLAKFFCLVYPIRYRNNDENLIWLNGIPIQQCFIENNQLSLTQQFWTFVQFRSQLEKVVCVEAFQQTHNQWPRYQFLVCTDLCPRELLVHDTIAQWHCECTLFEPPQKIDQSRSQLSVE